MLMSAKCHCVDTRIVTASREESPLLKIGNVRSHLSTTTDDTRGSCRVVSCHRGDFNHQLYSVRGAAENEVQGYKFENRIEL